MYLKWSQNASFIHIIMFIRSVIHCNVRFIEGIVTVQQIFSIISENYVIR